MLGRLVQPSKAPFSILVTLSGITIPVSPLHSRKASIIMAVTRLPPMVSGIISSPVAAVSQSVIRIVPLSNPTSKTPFQIPAVL